MRNGSSFYYPESFLEVLVQQYWGFKRPDHVGYIVALKDEFKHIGLILVQAQVCGNTAECENREFPLPLVSYGCFVQGIDFIAVFEVVKEQQ